MEWNRNSFTISTEKEKMDLDVVCELLGQSYWADQRERVVIERSIETSLCFDVYDTNCMVRFARVITDKAVFAWICDVIIHPDYRGQGLGKWMLDCMSNMGLFARK